MTRVPSVFSTMSWRPLAAFAFPRIATGSGLGLSSQFFAEKGGRLSCPSRPRIAEIGHKVNPLALSIRIDIFL